MENSTNLIFIQLALLLGVSSILGFVVHHLRLPMLIAYLLTGVLFSFLNILDLHSTPILTYFPEIGIAFVLFFIGMELDFDELRQLGWPILLAGMGQMVIATISGFSLASLLGFAPIPALFLGIGLSVSSTIVVIKMLLDKNDLSALYGKLALGILLLEDLVSVLILMSLTVGSSILETGLHNSLPFLTILIKVILLVTVAVFLAKFALERLFREVAAATSELLFLTALSWCFFFVAFSVFLGFSIVIGAFLAGIALANSPFHYEIQGKVKPLRDFFVILFFIYLGFQVAFENIFQALPLVVVFSTFALFVKPLVYLLLLGLFGFKKHTLFQTAICLNQISEFSLIIIVIGMQLGLVDQTVLTAMALTGVISIIFSSMMIKYARLLYRKLHRFIGLFERSRFVHLMEQRAAQPLEDHVVVVGAHRLGGAVVDFFSKRQIPVLVIDFNPRIIQALIEKGVIALYGDIGDPEIYEFLNLEKAKLVISTAQDREDNLTLLSELEHLRPKPIVIVRAQSLRDAQELYKAGADYVILPEVVASDFILHILKTNWPKLDFFRDREEVELAKLSKPHFALN